MLRHAVRLDQLQREAMLLRRTLVVRATPLRRSPVRGDLGPGSLLDPGREARVVEVVVRDQEELEVLDRNAVLAELLLEGRERVLVQRAGVDQRERLAPEQPDVD